MTRLDRVVKCFNDYDTLVQRLTSLVDREAAVVAESHLNEIRNEASVLIGELRRHGCRREN
jgi:hypothetical protein